MSLDLGIVGSIFINAMESRVGANDILVTVRLRKPWALDNLRVCYERFLVEHPGLCSRWTEDTASGSFQWRPFSDSERDLLLSYERDRLSMMSSLDSVSLEYHPTNSRLPFRISPIDPQTLVFSINHMITDGRGSLTWVSRFLRAYAAEAGIELPPESGAASEASGPTLSGSRNVRGLLATLAYFSRLYLRSFRRRPNRIVDLSHGATPTKNSLGHGIIRFDLALERGSDAPQHCRELTITEFLCASLARHLLSRNPTADCVPLLVPIDVRLDAGNPSLESPGSNVGSVPLQLFSGTDLDSETRAAFRWLRLGVGFWFLRGLAAMFRRPTDLKAHFQRLGRLSMKERGIFGNSCFVISNMGCIKDPVLVHLVEHISAHAKMQRPTCLLLTFQGRLKLELTFPLNLYRAEEVVPPVEAMLDDLVAAVCSRNTGELVVG